MAEKGVKVFLVFLGETWKIDAYDERKGDKVG